jgi:hypothetical protein
MRATPRLQRITEGCILSIEQLNLIINRIEYGADVLKAYKSLAGIGITIDQQKFGRVINSGFTSSSSASQIGDIPWNTRIAGNGANTMDGDPQLYAISYPPWNATNAKYAVWVNPSLDPLVRIPQTIYRTVNFPSTNDYVFIMSADNRLSVYLDNILVGTIINEQSGFRDNLIVTKNVTAGRHIIKFVAENTVGGSTWQTNPAGYSLEIQGFGTGVMATGYLLASNPNLPYSSTNGLYANGYVYNNAVPTIAGVTTPKYGVGNYFSGSNFVFEPAYTGSLDGVSVDSGFSLQIKYQNNIILAINGPKVIVNVEWNRSPYALSNLAGNGFSQFWSSQNWYQTVGFKGTTAVDTEWIIRKGTSVSEVGIGVPFIP